MISLKQSDLSPKEAYKILIGSVIPRPIAFISTLSDNNVLNLAPFSFYNIVSHNPPILSVSIQRKDGQMKDTTRNILNRREAVIHSSSENNIRDINQTAANLDSELSELSLTQMTTVASTQIETPGIKEASIRFETKLYQHIPIEENKHIIADLILLKVEHYHLDQSVYRDSYILADQLNPVSRLAGNDYAKLGSRLSMPRP